MEAESDVWVLLPTLNEAASIGEVIDGLHANGFSDILVMDGGSSDGTKSIAEERGARVEVQSGSGKGQAVIEAVEMLESEFVLMLDGDGTYRPDEAHRLMAPLRDGRADHVIGNRFHDMERGAMTRLNRFGNRQINRLFRYINRIELSDILSGYRAFRTDAFVQLDLSAKGFGIEAEMTGEAVRHGQDIEEVPITYQRRPQASQSNLRPIRDGAVIVSTLYRVARMNNPLFFFGSLGIVGIIAGVIVGGYVGARWYFAGVSHVGFAIVSSFLLIFGFQLIMFGVLSDMILSLHQEHRQRIQQLEDRLEERE